MGKSKHPYGLGRALRSEPASHISKQSSHCRTLTMTQAHTCTHTKWPRAVCFLYVYMMCGLCREEAEEMGLWIVDAINPSVLRPADWLMRLIYLLLIRHDTAICDFSY